jgi:hypothetical protein
VPEVGVILFIIGGSCWVFIAKFAVTTVSDSKVTTQLPVPEHPPPDQPVKVEFVSALALSVSFVPGLYPSVQSVPQLIPFGLLVTVPVPAPDFVIVMVYCWVVPIPESETPTGFSSGSFDGIESVAAFDPADVGENLT